jgi:hypothetical protein
MSNPLPENFKKMGPDQVRLLMQAGLIAPIYTNGAIEWLAEQDRSKTEVEALRQTQTDALMSAQMRMTRSANLAAWIAAFASIVALVLGAIQLLR